jgi:hypothetical protein
MRDILAPVKEVLTAELAGALSGKELVTRCTDVARELQRNYKGEAEVHHEVWHYLSDADIRVRDREYAAVQLRLMRSLVLSAQE